MLSVNPSEGGENHDLIVCKGNAHDFDDLKYFCAEMGPRRPIYRRLGTRLVFPLLILLEDPRYLQKAKSTMTLTVIQNGLTLSCFSYLNPAFRNCEARRAFIQGEKTRPEELYDGLAALILDSRLLRKSVQIKPGLSDVVKEEPFKTIVDFTRDNQIVSKALEILQAYYKLRIRFETL